MNTIDNVNHFSTSEQVALALNGNYFNASGYGYRMTMIKNVVFLLTHTDTPIDVELPSHYAFKYTDNSGEHFVDESTRKITIQGIVTIIFDYKY